MKSTITSILFLTTLIFSSFGQNIDDNKVNFKYIQLPLQKVNPLFSTYEVRVNHLYKKANEDSLLIFQQRKDAAQANYQAQYNAYIVQKNALDKVYLNQLAQYEKATNAGTPATVPVPPTYPNAPLFVPLDAPRLHTELTDNEVNSLIDIQGFTKGLGGSMLTIDVYPIRDIRIIETKTGSGATTKYDYKCQYILPIMVTFETPTEGALLKKTYFETIQYQSMKSYSSKYEYQAWFIDNGAQYYRDLERNTRKSALQEVNGILNNEFGYVSMQRNAELYSVKKYRDYDYAEVTAAYTLTTQALNLVAKDRNRASAIEKISQAIAKWEVLLGESNMTDDKARVNDKITAMIHCNLAELYTWKGDYDKAELHTNLSLNGGVAKFRNHSERVQSFYADQRKRWEVHY